MGRSVAEGYMLFVPRGSWWHGRSGVRNSCCRGLHIGQADSSRRPEVRQCGVRAAKRRHCF